MILVDSLSGVCCTKKVSGIFYKRYYFYYLQNTDLENLNAKLAETTKILDYTPVEKPTELLTSLQKENQEKAVAEELANKALEDENKKKQDEKNNENEEVEDEVEETEDKNNEDNEDKDNDEDEDEEIVEDVEAEDVEPDDEEIEEVEDVEDVEDEVEEEIIPDEVIVPENSIDKIKELKSADKDEEEEGEEDEEEEGKDKEGDDNEDKDKDDNENDEDSQNNEDDESEGPSSSLRASRRQEEEVDENQCRVCCTKDNLVSIFKKLEERTVAEMLMTICPSVSIAIKDFLPQYICNTCCDNVAIAIKLKNQCETTEKELRKKLSRHKNKIRRPVGYVVIDAPLDSDPPTDEEQANDEEFKVSDIASVTPSEDSETSDFSDSKKKKTRGRKRRKSAVVTPTDGKRSKNKSRSDDDDSSDENDDDGDPIKQKRKRSSNSSPENFACNECDQTFSRKQSLVLHKRQHVYDRGEPIKCEVCGKKFKIKGAYRTHLEKHREERRANKCNQCSRRFTNSSDLKRHIAEDHREKTILPTCSKCNRTFSSAGRLQRHKQNVCSASDSSKYKKSESHGFAVGTDLFKAVAPLQTTYWSDSFSD
ncbi:myb-like protein X [Lucilia cuprina]|uniref:myb-like protein X n=1 Tax=Lucilia cuprina TaxID=7375 RepID=UPI001F068FC8|nr:myb-like protein X [Lucilia cuprina]